ncbi:hypothetical protein PG984_003482 [Apiospora sp. TS-2023a]
MAVSNAYSYKRLCAADEIRIIALNPATEMRDPLKLVKQFPGGKFEHVFVSGFGTFDNLVYEWIHECVSGFFNQSWFSRRWVIQEVILARKAIIHCGSSTCSLRAVGSFAVWLHKMLSGDLKGDSLITRYPLKMAATLEAQSRNNSLLENLWHFHAAGCSERKDRIAALLGLSPNERFRLEYGSHWKDIYKQVAACALCSDNNDTKLQVLLHLFEFGPIGGLSDCDYPSWIPDWSNTRKRELPYYQCYKDVDIESLYPACLQVDDKTNLVMVDNILRIQPYPPVGGARSWQVMSVASPSMYRDGTEYIINTLERLFPPFEKESPTTNLSTLLHEFSLFTLRPRYEGGSGASRAVGFSPKEIFLDDTMIPLWRRRMDTSFLSDGCESHSVIITTMLVVRYNKEHHGQSRCRTQAYEEVGTRKGKIIGPAVCVEVRGELKWRTEWSNIDRASRLRKWLWRATPALYHFIYT